MPLARLAKRVFTTDETLHADIEVAHFGRAPHDDAVPTWKLVGATDQKVLAQGKMPARRSPWTTASRWATIDVDLANQFRRRPRCTLVVGLEEH